MITISVANHVTAGNNNNTINNELRRTIGHEIGHGIHVMHKLVKPYPPGPDLQCNDMAVGSGTSMMTQKWFNGDGPTKDSSKYNDSDVKQMRLHLHHP